MTIDVLKQARDALKYADDALADYLPIDAPIDMAQVEAFNAAICAVEAEIARLEGAEPKRLTAKARVGATVFGVGVEERLVIECAQRHYVYMQKDEPKRLIRAAKLRRLLAEASELP